jgi:hypothetical protein
MGVRSQVQANPKGGTIRPNNSLQVPLTANLSAFCNRWLDSIWSGSGGEDAATDRDAVCSWIAEESRGRACG